MKKILFLAGFLLFTGSLVLAADGKIRHFDAKGEVTSVDPLYSRITIKHGAIKDFAADGDTEFVVASSDLFRGINNHDLVDFSVIEEKGEARLEKITKTGEAPLRDDRLPVGKAIQDVLVATGETAKTVTSPIAPAHEVVSGAVNATTDTTGQVLDDASTEVKQKF